MWHETSDNLKDPLVVLGVNYHFNKQEEVYYLEYHDENMNYHTTDEKEMKDFVGCFLTGTAAEVTPVSQIAKNNFKVCDLITDLNKSYQNLVRKKSAA